MTRSKGVLPRVSIAEARERLVDAEREYERAVERDREAKDNVHLWPKHIEEFHRERVEAHTTMKNAREQLRIKLQRAKAKTK